jgi:hypothetical protein
MIDNDGAATYSIENHTFPNQGYTGSFIVFNPSTVSPSLGTDNSWLPYDGAKYLVCFSAMAPNNPNNDWIISEEFTASATMNIDLFVKSLTDQYGLERYNVYLMNGTTTSSIVQKLNTGTNYNEAPITWTNLHYVVTGHQGENLRIGIQCVSSDAFAFLVDKLTVVDPNGNDVNEIEQNESVIYPNPCTEGIVNIIAPNSITKVFTADGRLIFETNENIIDLNNQPVGIYILEIKSGEKTYNEKVVLK